MLLFLVQRDGRSATYIVYMGEEPFIPFSERGGGEKRNAEASISSDMSRGKGISTISIRRKPGKAPSFSSSLKESGGGNGAESLSPNMVRGRACTLTSKKGKKTKRHSLSSIKGERGEGWGKAIFVYTCLSDGEGSPPAGSGQRVEGRNPSTPTRKKGGTTVPRPQPTWSTASNSRRESLRPNP